MNLAFSRRASLSTRPVPNRLAHLVFASALLASNCTSEPASPPTPAPGPPIYMTEPSNFVSFTRRGSTHASSIAENQVLVTYRETAPATDRSRIENWLRTLGARLGGHAGETETSGTFQYVLRPGTDLNVVLDYLQSTSNRTVVFSALPNGEIYSLRDPNPNYDGWDDGFYWIDAIHARQAWDTTTGSTNIPIGIVDHGIQTASGHFEGKTIRFGVKCVNREDGFTHYLPIEDADRECHGYRSDYRADGHGTAVAALAAARGDERTGRSVGLAWENPIVSIDYLGTVGRSTYFSSVEGVILALRMGARIINLSSGPCDSPAADPTTCTLEETTNWRLNLLPAILEARRRDALVILSAGNSGFQHDDQWLPSDRHPSDSDYFDSNVIVVGGTDVWDNPFCELSYQPAGDQTFLGCNDGRRSVTCQCNNFCYPLWSVEGRVVELSAPAYRISIPDITRFDGSMVNVDGRGSGTSFSAPLVAGAAALVWARYPSYRAEQVKERLLNTARPGVCRTIGRGILDVGAAVGATTQDAGILDASADATTDARQDTTENYDGSTIAWTREYGNGYANVVRATSNGSVILGGADGSDRSRIFRVDLNGRQMWDTILADNPPTGHMINDIIETEDHGFAAVGSSGAPNDHGSSLFRLNSEGQEIWRRTLYQVRTASESVAIRPNSDGFVIFGNIGMIWRYSGAGNLIASDNSQWNDWGFITSAHVTTASDGGFFIGPIVSSLETYAIVKLNSAGRRISVPFGTCVSSSAGTFSIARSNANMLLSAGSNIICGESETGTVLWTRTFATRNSFWEVAPVTPGVIAVGTSNATDRTAIWLVRLDDTGNTVWERRIEPSQQIDFRLRLHVQHVSDGFIISATSASGASPRETHHPLLIRVNEDGR